MDVPRLVGAPLKRLEDKRLITGSGKFVDDIQLPNTVYLHLLRSPVAHAKIRKIDYSKIVNEKKVLAVLTGGLIEGICKPIPCLSLLKNVKIPVKYPLAVDRVLYVGDPVAAVVAQDRYAAEDAVESIEVDYENLPALLEPEESLRGDLVIHPELGDNVAHQTEITKGDVEEAFKDSIVLKERFTNQRIGPVAIEPRAVLANFDTSGLLNLWTSTQIPHIVRTEISKMIRLPENRLRVIAPDVGGAFGSKLNVYAEEALASILSIKLGRPVKWFESRRENLMVTTHGRDQICYIELGAKKDGLLTGLRARIIADIGAYHQILTPSNALLTIGMLPQGYNIKNIHLELIEVFTNKMATDAYRGAGRPESSYFMERMVDLLSYELKMDPAEIRFKNLVQPDKFPFETATGMEYDSGNYPHCLRRALDLVNYEDFRREQMRLQSQGRYLGLGIGFCVEICGFGPSKLMDATFGGYESATVRVDPSGTITLVTGNSPQGQGHETAFSQIVADEFGIKPGDIVVVHGDTGTTYGIGTFGSRAAGVGAEAVLSACRRLQGKILNVAAHLMKESTLVFQSGTVYSKENPSKFMYLREIASSAYRANELPAGVEPGLEATVFYEPTRLQFPFAAHIAVVEVDIETGLVKLLKLLCVDDCGKVINPLLVEGQIHGGAAQAIGQALLEEIVYDETGQLVTSTLMDYYLPTALEIPQFEVHRTETPAPTALGAKGVGELATIASTPAVVNAVEDALRPFKVKIRKMPVKPDHVWKQVLDMPNNGS